MKSKSAEFFELIRTGFNFYFNNFFIIFIFTIIVYIPVFLLSYIIKGNLLSYFDPDSSFSINNIYGIVFTFCSCFQKGFIILFYFEKFKGKTINKIIFKKILNKLFRKIFYLFVIELLLILALVIGFFILIIPGIFLLIIFSMVYIVFLIENKSINSSFDRSISLSKGYRLYIAGFLLTLIILFLLLFFTVFAFTDKIFINYTIKKNVFVVSNTIFNIFIRPIYIIFILGLFFKIKIEKEKYDLELDIEKF